MSRTSSRFFGGLVALGLLGACAGTAADEEPASDEGAFTGLDEGFENDPNRVAEAAPAPALPKDYVARSAAVSAGWLADARAAFLAGYGGVGSNEQALVDALELEKACYEIRYEASNRPDWLWLPLDALERLAA